MDDKLRALLEKRKHVFMLKREQAIHEANQRIGELNGRLAEIDDLLALGDEGEMNGESALDTPVSETRARE